MCEEFISLDFFLINTFIKFYCVCISTFAPSYIYCLLLSCIYNDSSDMLLKQINM